MRVGQIGIADKSRGAKQRDQSDKARLDIRAREGEFFFLLLSGLTDFSVRTTPIYDIGFLVEKNYTRSWRGKRSELKVLF